MRRLVRGSAIWVSGIRGVEEGVGLSFGSWVVGVVLANGGICEELCEVLIVGMVDIRTKLSGTIDELEWIVGEGWEAVVVVCK